MSFSNKLRDNFNRNGINKGFRHYGDVFMGNMLGWLSAFFPSSIYGDSYSEPGITFRHVWKGTFSYSDKSVSGSCNVGDPIPSGAILLRSYVDVTTTFKGNGDDSSTLAITSGQGANDVVLAVAIKTGTPWDKGLHEGIQSGSMANAIKLTAERQPQVVVAIASTDTALTAGSMDIYIEYVISTQV